MSKETSEATMHESAQAGLISRILNNRYTESLGDSAVVGSFAIALADAFQPGYKPGRDKYDLDSVGSSIEALQVAYIDIWGSQVYDFNDDLTLMVVSDELDANTTKAIRRITQAEMLVYVRAHQVMELTPVEERAGLFARFLMNEVEIGVNHSYRSHPALLLMRAQGVVETAIHLRKVNNSTLGDNTVVGEFTVALANSIHPDLRPGGEIRDPQSLQTEIRNIRKYLTDSYSKLWGKGDRELGVDIRVIVECDTLNLVAIHVIRKIAIAGMFAYLKALNITDFSMAEERAALFVRFLIEEIENGNNILYREQPEILLLRAQAVAGIGMHLRWLSIHFNGGNPINSPDFVIHWLKKLQRKPQDSY